MRKFIGVLVILALLGVAGFFAWKYFGPKMAEMDRQSVSDAAKNSVGTSIGGDNYIGYFYIMSPEMRKQCSANGILIDYQDDKGAYADRLKKFAEGKLDIIVLPINSYLQHGSRHKFPGAITVAISESKGADGLVGFKNTFKTGSLNTELNNPNLTFVFTPNSPTSFLIDQTITHFDLFNLKGNLRSIEANGSEDVLKYLKKKQGDVFGLWEPDLSEALQVDGVVYVWGSDKFSGLITDVMVFRYDFIKKYRETALKFLNLYFRVMTVYKNNPDKWFEDMRKVSGLKKDVLQKVVKKIEWYDLQANCNQMFGIGIPGQQTREGVIDGILACTDILIRSKVLPNDPTKGDPYMITDKDLLKELSKSMVLPAVAAKAPSLNTLGPLSDDGWRSLRELGSMQVDPVTFQFSEDRLDDSGKMAVTQVAVKLKNNYPDHWIVVRGHTAGGDDEYANKALSLKRAQTVIQYLKAVHAISEYRLRAEGAGSIQPPEKRPDESPRAYRYRLSRVEFVLMERQK